MALCWFCQDINCHYQIMLQYHQMKISMKNIHDKNVLIWLIKYNKIVIIASSSFVYLPIFAESIYYVDKFLKSFSPVQKAFRYISVCISIVNVHLFVHDIRAFVTNINYGMVEKSILIDH